MAVLATFRVFHDSNRIYLDTFFHTVTPPALAAAILAAAVAWRRVAGPIAMAFTALHRAAPMLLEHCASLGIVLGAIVNTAIVVATQNNAVIILAVPRRTTECVASKWAFISSAVGTLERIEPWRIASFVVCCAFFSAKIIETCEERLESSTRFRELLTSARMARRIPGPPQRL